MASHAADSGKVFAAILVLVAAHVRGPVLPVVEDRQHAFDAARGGFLRRLRKELAVQLLAGVVNRPAEIVWKVKSRSSTARGDRFFAP
jgi:hypothetical protein